MSEMFCYQCQEAAGNTGCTKKGVCGKPADVAGLQDFVIWQTKGLSEVAEKVKNEGGALPENLGFLVCENLFGTITNADFDPKSQEARVAKTLEVKGNLLNSLKDKSNLSKAALYDNNDPSAWQADARSVGVQAEENEDLRSLKELIVYGLKGLAAYMTHAMALGYDDAEITDFMINALAELLKEKSMDDLVGLTVKTGEFGVKAMALLDKANTESYGNPEITEVSLGVGTRPGILVSGHDLKDFEDLLKQSEGKGVDIYTHGEMLPAHYYPAFKKYDHFVGNYGGSWWHQKEEFESFNGPILMTTNCIVPPKDSYKDKLFTTGSAHYPGCPHIEGESPKDYTPIIEKALQCEPPVEIETGKIVGGFAHNQVLALADTVVEAVKSGAIKKFVVMAGCDGRHKSRSYYTDFAEGLSDDTVILTAGCAKYRYNKLNLGDIGGVPRVLDAGQCNDSYSLAVIAMTLQKVFELEDINDLPIVYNIAWYEQKAVIVLLALLALGVKNIHLGPTLPAFLSPNVANFLVETFNIGGITDVESDLQTMMA